MTSRLRLIGAASLAFVIGFALPSQPGYAEEAGCFGDCDDHCPAQWSFYNGTQYVPYDFTGWCSFNGNVAQCYYEGNHLEGFNCPLDP